MRPAHDINAHSLPHITYSVRSGTSPEMELSTLANIYRFILGCHAKKKAAPESRPEDPERRSDEIRAKSRIP
jgi:hypothetical protein